MNLVAATTAQHSGERSSWPLLLLLLLLLTMTSRKGKKREREALGEALGNQHCEVMVVAASFLLFSNCH